jgi:hypothetical protein
LKPSEGDGVSCRKCVAAGFVVVPDKTYVHTPQRILLLSLTPPPMAAKVESQMAQARRDIEKKLIPSGPQVVRHLSLPPEGKTKDWILSEMDKMDSYCYKFDDRGRRLYDWKEGKVSGAVYREPTHPPGSGSSIECMDRRQAGLDERDCCRLRTLLRF